MKHRPATPLPPDLFPPDPWKLVERGFNPELLPRSETLFALANGYLGIRGSLEEGAPVHEPGTFINGFHETWDVMPAEPAYGLETFGQSIAVLPDASRIMLCLDGEPLDLSRGLVRDYVRTLDMQAGVLHRELTWESPSGITVRLQSERLVSFEHRHVAALTFECTVLAGSAPLTVVSDLRSQHLPSDTGAHSDPRRGAAIVAALPPVQGSASGTRAVLGWSTRKSNMTVSCGIDHRAECDSDLTTAARTLNTAAGVDFSFRGTEGTHFRLEKYSAYHEAHAGSGDDLDAAVAGSLDHAMSDGYRSLRERQRSHMSRFWERADVRIEGDDVTQQAVRWNLFQLAQATLRADGQGIPAKGLTGRGYDGHYFWDTETYVLPFLAYTHPWIARSLLQFRHDMLNEARERARTLDEDGALFPWRTINGQEASAFFWAGTAQYHINADIAHALQRYIEATGDDDALSDFGAELLVETARMWASLGFYDSADGHFHIHGVTGPDEYTAVVDDNTYTNLMARENLRSAINAVETLRHDAPRRFSALQAELNLHEDESDNWHRAADAMFLPYDEQLGVHPQDAHFFAREIWDLDATPADRFPLLLHYHPLVLYRHQVIKQADVVLAMFLLGEQFTEHQKRANFRHYEPMTTGDSSLSHAVQSIVAAEIGDQELATEHFGHALFMDLGNWAGNAEDGVHIASAAGVWLAAVQGFAGMRDHGGRLEFHPHLPSDWSELAFSLQFRGSVLSVALHATEIRLRLDKGASLTVRVKSRNFTVRKGAAVTVSLGQS